MVFKCVQPLQNHKHPMDKKYITVRTQVKWTQV